MQTDPTLLTSNTQHCWAQQCCDLLRPFAWNHNNVGTCWHLLALVAYSLKPVKLLGSCKRTQHCWPTSPNNVGSCWHLLRPFAWALRSCSVHAKFYGTPLPKENTSTLSQRSVEHELVWHQIQNIKRKKIKQKCCVSTFLVHR